MCDPNDIGCEDECKGAYMGCTTTCDNVLNECLMQC